MVEGDITLLLAGVLAHGQAFGDYSFLQVLAAGTLAGVASDNVAYALGRAGRARVKKYRFYCAARPRLERLTDKFGVLSIFVSKFTYGLRWGSCAFYGVAKMPYARFLALSFASCFMWVVTLSGVGYVFHSAIYNLIGDFHALPASSCSSSSRSGSLGFYLAEKYWLSKKVEEASPETHPEVRAGRRGEAPRDQGRDTGFDPPPARAPQGGAQAEEQGEQGSDR